MKKWMRNYIAEFEIGHRDKNNQFVADEEFSLSYPFTCNFATNIGTSQSSNSAVFQFINLDKDTQRKLWKDMWQTKKWIKMSFYAGYGANMPLIFKGLVLDCTSYRESGSTEFITNLSVMNDGGLKRFGYINATYTEGTQLYDIINMIIKDNSIAELGYISPDLAPLNKDRTLIGQPLDLLSRNYSGYEIFLNENLELSVIGENDVLPGEIEVITDSTGLLGSPRRANSFVEIETIFEPQLRIGQAISLLSKTIPDLNQAYKIVNIEHKGTISPVVCGKLTTKVILSMFDREPRKLKKQPPTTYTGKPTQGQWNKPVQGRVSSPFGYRNQPNAKASTYHKGMDIAAPLNTTVYAPANGKVIASYISGSLTSDLGRLIKIDHGEINGKQVQSWYGHLNKWLVGAGDVVSKSQPIALVGNTGNSTGPHLHFGIFENSIAVNPTKYIGTYG